jgi:hypothetical protein
VCDGNLAGELIMLELRPFLLGERALGRDKKKRKR